MAEIKLEDWFPMSPMEGPPLPEFLNIYWPWYKEEEEPPPEEPPPALPYSCHYCEQSFATLDELIAHVAEDHKDKPPLGKIIIDWE